MSTDINGRVVTLSLVFNGLKGALPEELGTLTRLRFLNFGINDISDISPLRSLTNLKKLNLSYNKIYDLSPLAGLTKLSDLNLSYNDISDLTPLAGLTKLSDLNLSYNDISDLTPLSANMGLGEQDRINVTNNNPLNAESTAIHIPTLEARGVDISYDEFIGVTEPFIYNDNVFVLPVEEDLTRVAWMHATFSRRFYEHFEDAFDFLVIASNLRDGLDLIDGYNASYVTVSNNTRGIGLTIHAFNADYGSASRLQGVVHFASWLGHPGGPLLHELMHRWGNFIVPTSDSSHWGFSNGNGYLSNDGVGSIVDLGDGKYAAGQALGHRGSYSPIELYLAGMASPDEVPDLWVAEDAAWLWNENGTVVRAENGDRIFTASGIRTYTIEDIIAEHGPRVPDESQAQRSFRAAVILLVNDRYPATRQNLEELSAHLDWFSHPSGNDSGYHNFFEATLGRGTMKMDGLSELLKDREYQVQSWP